MTFPLTIGDAVTEGATRSARELRHDVGHYLESALASDETVQAWIDEQRERERHAPAARPARPLARCHGAHLGRAQREPPRVERLAERDRYGAGAVPAQLDDDGLERREPQGGRKTLGRAARVKDEIRLRRRSVRRGETDAEPRRDRVALAVRVDELDPAPRDAAGKPGDEASHDAAADHRDAIADARPAVPDA